MKRYHYIDKVSGSLIISDVEILTNGVELNAVIELADPLSADEAKALALHDLPKLIPKQPKTATTDDP